MEGGKLVAFADEFVVRLADGIIGWFSYQQAANRSGVYSEYLFYPPMFEIGHGRGWKVTCQKRMADNRRMTFDMLFRYPDRMTAVALEAKFIRPKKTFTGNIENDLRKLHKVLTDDDNHPPGYNMNVFQLIVGKAEQIKRAIEGTPLHRQWDTLWREGGRKMAEDHAGWLLHGQGQKSFRYSVAVFRYRDTWDLDGEIELEPVGGEEGELEQFGEPPTNHE